MDYRKHEMKYRNKSLIIRFLKTFMIFDLWLLLKAGWLLRHAFRIGFRIAKFCFIMLVGAGLLIAYTVLTNNRFDIPNQIGVNYCKNNQMSSKYHQLNDDSMNNLKFMRKEFSEIRTMKMNIQKSLFNMNAHLQNLYNQQKLANLADFAAESVGGIVIDTPDTQSYYNPSAKQITFFGIPIFKPNYFTPRKVIQPWTQPGECWAFRGSQGKIEIELAHDIFINRVSLEHITAIASLTGNIDSAPKVFNILGQIGNQYVMIDTFVYNNNGQSLQTFAVTKPEIKNIPFKRVMLEILSNWGNSEYTCIYRFKVHGKMYEDSKDNVNKKVQ